MEEEILQEIEAVKSVYGPDCSVLEEFPPHVRVSLKPRTAEDLSQQFVEAVLVIKANPQYPVVPPKLDLIDSKGLDDKRHSDLLLEIQHEAEMLASSPMLVALCEAAIDKLSNMNHPEGNCSFCLFPLVTEDTQSALRPFMKLMSCFHCFHSDCFGRWWRWLQEQNQHGKCKSANTTLSGLTENADENYSHLPYRAPYWQSMIDAVAICGPGFKAPTENELSGYLLDEMVEDMKVELASHRKDWIEKGCTIMTDGWTDRRNRTLLNFLISCGGYTMFIKSIDASAHIKNATYLCEVIEEVIAEVGEENVVQVVTDNAASYVAAGKLLMERHPTIFWSPCAAHCLDLMLEEIGKLEWVKSCVERAKSICKFIYNHSFVLSTMRTYTGGKELARPGITRFASNFITLQSLLTSKAELRRMIVGHEWTTSSYATTTAGVDVANCIFDEDGFWEPAKEILAVTEPLVSLLRIADAEKPSMGYIYEGMDRAKEAIRAQYGGVHEKYAPIWEIIDRRWQNQLHRPIHAAAYYLNPAFRFRHDFKADEEVHTGLFTVIQRLSCDEDSLAATIELDKFNNKEGPSFSSKMAIDAQKNLQPDRWWQLFGSGTPKLQKIATRILSQPSSASGCERSWSMFEHIHSKRRNRLSVQRLNDLVFVHYNLRLRIRQILGADSSLIILEEIDPES